MELGDYEKEEKQKLKDAKLKIDKLLEDVKKVFDKNKYYFWKEQERIK